MTQLAFDLRWPPSLAREDFILTPANAGVLAALDRPEDWPQGRAILIGPAGAGKSHLAAFWASERGAPVVAASDLTVAGADYLAQEGGTVVIENADRACPSAETEQALFHLYNLSQVRGTVLLLTARQVPRDWGMTLPDLRSRLDTMMQIRLGQADEALLTTVLVKLFNDRQLAISPAFLSWLVTRMARDLGQARYLVSELDRRALAIKGPVTRAMASDILAEWDDRQNGAAG